MFGRLWAVAGDAASASRMLSAATLDLILVLQSLLVLGESCLPGASDRASMPRMRQSIARMIGATLFCAAFIGAPQARRLADTGQARAAQARRPNVLLIIADDLNS